MKTDKIIRMRMSTYLRIRKVVKAYPEETAAHYFKRVAQELER